MQSSLDPFSVDAAALLTCTMEPIHVPGSIQSRGILIALDRTCESICFASANAAEYFRRPLAQLLGGSATALLGPDLPLKIRSVLSSVRDGIVVPIDWSGGDGEGASQSAMVHRFDDRVILEIVNETPDVDTKLAITSAVSAVSQARRQGEESLPLQFDPLAVVAAFQRAASALATDPELLNLCDSVAQEVRRLTGYDRVMVYQFDQRDNGSVIAEARRDDVEPFLGLHYPASDIPAQARALYVKTRVRVLESVYGGPVPLLAAANAASERPLDMSYALLRSMSPIHRQYLHNMGVEATLTVSIIVDGRLWGLIACHHYAPKWPSFMLRAACDMLSEFVSVQVTVQENYARASARARASAAQSELIRELIIAGGRFEDVLERLQALVPCSGLAIAAEGRVHVAGITPPPARVSDIVTWLSQRSGSRITAFDSLGAENPAFTDLVDTASGLLAIDIGGTQLGFLLWFRPEVSRTVRWAGAPGKVQQDVGGVPRLSPRGSFAEWLQEQHGHAEPWSLEEITAAEAVRGALVEVVLESLATRQRIARLELVRIRAAVEGASDPVAVADPGGQIIYANPALLALTGLSAADARSPEAIFGLPAPRAGSGPGPSARSGVAAAPTRNVQVVGANGARIPMALRIDPIYDEAGQLVGTLYIGTDLRPRLVLEEERRRMERKLTQTQKLESLGVLAGGVAHDFNNLLTTIVANAALAHEELPPNSDAHENLHAISRAAQRAAALCRVLLAYAGRGRFDVQPIDLNEVVLDMGGLLRSAIGSRISTDFHFQEDLLRVSGDAAQLRQMMMNLIVNASDAIDDEIGRIDITTMARDADRALLDTFQMGEALQPGRYVELRVSDTGSGMSPETVANIFDPFFVTKNTGHGLGLAAVLGIVRGHDGGIRIESRPGVGSTFTVILPAFASTVAGAPDMKQASRIAGARRTIMLVDDENEVREVASRILERAGFGVLLAEDGVQALDVITTERQSPIALVVADLSMPRLGGVALLQRLRELGNSVPLLLISGYAEEEVLTTLARHAPTAFLQKPFDIDQLLNAVSALLSDVPAGAHK